jgi:hypothetical protein
MQGWVEGGRYMMMKYAMSVLEVCMCVRTLDLYPVPRPTFLLTERGEKETGEAERQNSTAGDG